jgi:hypothetical protein
MRQKERQIMLDHPLFAPALVFLVLLVGGITLVWALSTADRRRRRHVLANGQTLKAWLV